MKINSVKNQKLSFKQIKLDGNIAWELLDKAGEKEVTEIKNMSLKGFEFGYVFYDREINCYILKGMNPSVKGKECCSYLGRYITAQRVKNAINSYNRAE